MSKKINVIIIDDEPLALEGMLSYVENIKYFEVIGCCENAMDALEILESRNVDLMFLDINMPKISGIDFLKTLKTKPLTIITSAYPEYALEGYELDIIDYLVKPFGFERFLKASNKAKDFFDCKQTEKVQKQENYIFLKCEKKIEKIFFKDILYIESLHNYIAIFTDKKRFVTYLTLKNIEDHLPKLDFLKIQKSFIVSKSKIESINEDNVVIRDKQIPISRLYKDEILKQILGDNYIKNK